jgi:hypothetical protein
MIYSRLEGQAMEGEQKHDPRQTSVAELRTKTDEAVNLNEIERETLFKTLLKYINYCTAKPGKCTTMRYSFEVTKDEEIVGASRPIPFAARTEVREQIAQLLKDGIIEPSNSSYINPLTVVLCQGKTPRICLDARRVNKHMVPDRTRTQVIGELLRKFHGSKYISTLDLSSAFLQVELEPKSRKYTAFLFEAQVYQYTRIPYGFRNSLSAFVRALKLALGTDTSGYALCYVDDITVHSPTFGYI